MKTIIHLLILLFFLMSGLPGISQEPSKQNAILIKNLVAYRDTAITSNTEVNQRFRETLEKWIELEPDEEALKYHIFNCQYSSLVKRNDFKYTQKVSQKKTDNSPLSESFTETELNILTQKIAFLLFICADVFDIHYPYKINDNQIFKELEFYDLKENEIVADIGSGQGQFSLLLYYSKNHIKIYSSEINQE